MAAAGSAHAQAAYPGAPAPGAQVRRHLETLAENPNSVQALIDAGRVALDMGDAAAALGFYTRASQLAAGNPRVKVGLAAAHARSGRPQNAIMLFSQAQAMGIPLGEFAGERGLAYDLMGQPAMAQQDYVAALRYREDPEVRRRLALSLAITGQREAALRVIAPQVQRADRGGLRTRALVLALSGDAAGAMEAARTSMPPGTAQSMAPFFQRIAALTPGQMASAAHLGRFPAGGGFRMAGTARPASDPGALAFAGGGTTPNVALAASAPVAVPAATAPSRRAGEGRSRSARRAAARETRTLASASNSARATREARRRVERWDRASWSAGLTERQQARAPAETRQLASRPVTNPNPVQPDAAPAPAAPAVTSQALATAIPAPVVTPPSQPSVATTAQLLQPHPFEPLRPGSGAGSGGAAGLAATTTPDPVQLASAAPTAIPAAAQAAPPAATPLVEAAATPVQTAQAAVPSQAAAANWAVWNAAGANPSPVAPAASANAAPAATPVAATSLAAAAEGMNAIPAVATSAEAAERTGPAFADVIAAISSLPTETEATPARAAEPAPARTRPALASRSSASATTRNPARPAAREAARTTASASRPTRAETARGSAARPATAQAERGTASSARPATAQSQPRTRQPAHPTRIWVQVATAARASLPAELNRLRRLAPELLRSRTGYTAPIGSSDRLLVGPFETAAEARSFVNRLKEEDISSYPWTSDSGQQVDRLPAGR